MTRKKVIIAAGSPRKNGNSLILAKQVAAGAQAGGGVVETFFLADMNIKPCIACDLCRKKPGAGCILHDDMKKLYSKLKTADAIVLASPVYWFSFSAQTKLFIDRWYALGTDTEGYELAGKRFGLLLTYADPDPFISGAVNALRSFQDAVRYLGGEIAGMVYGSAGKAGEIRQNKKLLEDAFELGKKLVSPC